MPRRVFRLVGLAVLLVYSAALVLAAWPRLLTPPSQVVAELQLASRMLFFALGTQAGQGVFGGFDAPAEVTRSTCFRVVGRGSGGEQVLFDDFQDCRDARVALVKDPWAALQRTPLRKAFARIRSSQRPADINAYPLNYHFAFSDYYCRTDASIEVVDFYVIYTSVGIDTGEVSQREVHEGQRGCGAIAWTVF